MRLLPIVSKRHIFLTLIISLFLMADGCDRKTELEKISGDRKKDIPHSFTVLDPGHYHAALAFKRPGYKGVSPLVGIYAPVGDDIVDIHPQAGNVNLPPQAGNAGN